MKKSSLLMVFIFLSSGYFTFITNYENENSFSSDSEISYSGQTKSYEWKADTIGSVIAIATSEDGKYVVAVTQGVWNSSASMSDSQQFIFLRTLLTSSWQHTLSSFGGFTDVAIFKTEITSLQLLLMERVVYIFGTGTIVYRLG